jgi:hypothetical protein
MESDAPEEGRKNKKKQGKKTPKRKEKRRRQNRRKNALSLSLSLSSPLTEKAAHTFSTGRPGSVCSTWKSLLGVKRTTWPVRHV